jgi:amino acid adenylation domain-containing protein
MQAHSIVEQPESASIKELFEIQANRRSNQTAVVCGSHKVTYGELNARANRLAHTMRNRGIDADMPVGVCTRRSLEMLIAVLAITKAGGAYLPLDPTYPVERLLYMLNDSRVRLVLCHGLEDRFKDDLLPRSNAECIELSGDYCQTSSGNERDLDLDIPADSIAYVIYTSGSTGTPKGVLGTNRGMLNRLRWMWQQFPFAHGETCCVKTSLSFLDSYWEMFGPLLQGIPVVIMPDEVVKDAERLVQELESHGVSRLVLVPSLLRVMLTLPDVDRRLRSIKLWVTSGEALSPELARSFRQIFPHTRLLNLYGSSEVSADCAWYDTGECSPEKVAIGRPIPNNELYILDADHRITSGSVAGELYVTGTGLARGYLGNSILTAERFVPNPFGPPGSRMFRSGDVARRRTDGACEFLGRRDDQVKIRGFRVELGEIEAVLNRHPAIAQTAVIAFEPRPGQKQLAAYVIFRAGVAVSLKELQDYVADELPDFMVPAVIVPIDALPLTPSGKMDRGALPAPKYTASKTRPRTLHEEILADLFADVLGLEHRAGVDIDFFDLGGDSISVIELVSRARTAGLAITAQDVFRHQNVTAIAAVAKPVQGQAVNA